MSNSYQCSIQSQIAKADLMGPARSRPKGSEHTLAVFPFFFFFFLFLFSLTGFHIIRCDISVPFFSVFCIGFSLLIYLLSSPRMLLPGIFRLLWHQRSWFFFRFLVALYSFHCFPPVFRLELPLVSAFYVLPSSVMRTYLYPIPF